MGRLKLSAHTNSELSTVCDGYRLSVYLGCLGLDSVEAARITRNKTRSIKILCASCLSNLNNFNQMKTLLDSFKQDLNARILLLENKIENLIAKIVVKEILPETFEEVACEATETVSRAHNVIIGGLPERTGNLDERIKADEEAASEILSIVLKNKPTPSVVKMITIGKTVSTNKPRLLKITFAHPVIVKDILRQKNGLLGTKYDKV